MRDQEFLELAPGIIEALTDALPKRELNRVSSKLIPHIESLRNGYTIELYHLAQQHYRLARKSNSNAYWRHCVSRSYYAAYCASRGVRVFTEGDFNSRGNDHQLIVKLPSDFPNRNHWVGTLPGLRADRNSADYDPSSKPSTLRTSPAACVAYAHQFLDECRKYLISKGAAL